jgi:phage tail-like protein
VAYEWRKSVPELLRAFRFTVTLLRSPEYVPAQLQPPNAAPSGTPLGEGAFQECSGLEMEMDVHDHLEGGRNDGVVRRVGRAKFPPLVLKRGMFAGSPTDYVNTDLWAWLEGVVSGLTPVRRFDGIVTVHHPQSNAMEMAQWMFYRGLPAKWTGPTLNAQPGEVGIEELQIAHEGLRIKHVSLPEELRQ